MVFGHHHEVHKAGGVTFIVADKLKKAMAIDSFTFFKSMGLDGPFPISRERCFENFKFGVGHQRSGFNFEIKRLYGEFLPDGVFGFRTGAGP